MSKSKKEVPSSFEKFVQDHLPEHPPPSKQAHLGPRMGLLLATLAHATWTSNCCIRLHEALQTPRCNEKAPTRSKSCTSRCLLQWLPWNGRLPQLRFPGWTHVVPTARGPILLCRVMAGAQAIKMRRIPKCKQSQMQQRNVEVVDAQAKQIIHIPRTLVPSPE